MAEQRLQKILARAGVASRRAAEELIAAGRVAVDGQIVRQPGHKADPDTQSIAIDGKPIARAEAKEYWLAHKPAGYVSTVHDPQGRPRVLDLLPPEIRARLYPVGRLDLDSEGLMLLTNDGDLALRLTHPRYGVPKTYRVWLSGRPNRADLEALRAGVEIEGRQTAPAMITVKAAADGHSKVSMVLREGRKREIKLMWKARGLNVIRLVRVGLGPLRLGDLPPGAVRRLSPAEIQALRRQCHALSGCKDSADGVQKSARGARKAPSKKSTGR